MLNVYFISISRYKRFYQKKCKRKVKGVPQSQDAALPSHQEETSANRTNVRKALRLALFPKRGNRSANRTENTKTK